MLDIDFLKSRRVMELIHYTPVTNLPGILTSGLVPRSLLEQDGSEFVCTDENRHDGKDHVNLSITNPNIRALFKCRKLIPVDFVVLVLDVELLSRYRHSYRATNAASNRAMSCNVEELFWGQRPDGFATNWTSDNQAEVLVDKIISPNFIRSIHFPAEGGFPSECILQCFEQTREIIKQTELNIQCVVHDEKFAWNALAVGAKEVSPYAAYYQSWKNNFVQYEQIVEKISEYKWSTKFDSVAVSRNDSESLTLKSTEAYRSNVAQWRLDYYRPEDVTTRTDNELSAIAVMEKIILRGRITTVSRSLEKNVGRSRVEAAHKIIASIIELTKHQKLARGMKIFVCDVPEFVAKCSIDDIKELSLNVCSLYSCDDLLEGITYTTDIEKADLIISGTAVSKDHEMKTAVITNLQRKYDIIKFDFTRVQKPVTLDIQYDNLRFLLEYIFGFEDFRENQVDGILRSFERKDSIVLLPTGSGKSVVFQLLALITPGVAFVVSPIIALIEDQVDNLYSRGIDRVIGISSSMDGKGKSQAIDGITKGQFIINYVSPERFQNSEFLDAIGQYTNTNIVSVVAIDEAHCVSEWGHDFRTAYLGLAHTCRTVCSTGEYVPPLLALTGTASASVLRDMQNDLGILGDDAVIQPDSFDRPEILYRVIQEPSNNKMEVLEKIIVDKLPVDFDTDFESFYRPNQGSGTNSGIVFCQTVDGLLPLLASDAQLEYGHPGIVDVLDTILPGEVGIYASKIPKRLHMSENKWFEMKRRYAKHFKNNELSVMVCTKAFGMGIDKPNIRWIIHFGMPGSLESYYQEVGRAARDKRTAYAYLILSDDFPMLNQEILNPVQTNVENIAKKEQEKGRYSGDDVSRVMYFHQGTFTGVEEEVEQVHKVLEQCTARNWKDRRFHIAFNKTNKKGLEKSVYRLQLLGFFKSYRVKYQDQDIGEFIIEADRLDRNKIIDNYIEYIRAYQDNDEYAEVARKTLEEAVEDTKVDRDFIIKVVEILLREFTYKIIEEGRRRATLNMLEAAKAASLCKTATEADSVFRNKLLAYLSTDMKKTGQRYARLRDIINKATDTEMLLSIVESVNIRSRRENILGETNRLLEAYPQHYGLHYIQAGMHLGLGDYDKLIDSMKSLLKFGAENYGLSRERIHQDIVAQLNSKVSENIQAELWDKLVPRFSSLLSVTNRELYERLESEQGKICCKINAMTDITDFVILKRNYSPKAIHEEDLHHG